LRQYACQLVNLERYEEAFVALQLCYENDEKMIWIACNLLLSFLSNVDFLHFSI